MYVLGGMTLVSLSATLVVWVLFWQLRDSRYFIDSFGRPGIVSADWADWGL
jgi:hypothetical protein